MGNSAVPSNYVTSVLGYVLQKGFFNPSSPNLPQNISILGEANHANQSGLVLTGTIITSTKQAATLYGYGSPIYSVCRILFNNNCTVPVTVYPQLEAGGSVAKVITVTPTGTATANGTVNFCVSGREQVDSQSYSINVVIGDDPTAICDKMRTAFAAVLGCPLIGSGTSTFIGTAKWQGLTSNDINIVVDMPATSIGVTFAVVNTTAGAGTPSIGSGTGATTGLDFFGNAWNTIVINTYGLVAGTLTSLESYNGVPDETNPTGQYAGIIMRPLLALSGTKLDDPTSITVNHSTQVTVVTCPAPLTLGMPYEAAANVAVLWAKTAQDTPHGDIQGQAYPDMPGPDVAVNPSMSSVAFRQYCVTRGCSTVNFQSGNGTPGTGTYTMVDFVTTYNVSGEFPPFYQYPRTLNIHFNYKFGYYLKQLETCEGKALVPDTSIVRVGNVVKPLTWRAVLEQYNLDCESRALIVNAAANNKLISVTINNSNPNRMDTEEPIQISGYGRIFSTAVKGGFFFGN